MPQTAQVESRRAISANIHLGNNIGLAAIVGDRKSRLPAFVEKASLLRREQSWQVRRNMIMVV
jgi:hypothetical protein